MMSRLFALLIVVALAVAALGYWRGWFEISRESTTDQKTGVTVTVDKEEFNKDKDRAERKVDELKREARDAVNSELP